MRPVTLLTQSFLLVTSVVAVPAILQPRKDLATGCAYLTNLESDVTALSKEITSLTSTDIISDIEAIVAEIEKLTTDTFALGAALSCVGLKTKRDSLSSPDELSALQQRSSLCATAKAVEAEIEALVASTEALLGIPGLDAATTAEITKILDSLVAPFLPLFGC